MAELSTLTVEVKAKGIAQTTKELGALSNEASKAEDAVEGLTQEQKNNEKIGQEHIKATKKLVDQLKLEGQSVGKTKDEIKILKLEQSGATQEQIKAAKAALDYKNQLLEQAKAADIAEKEQQQLAGASNVVKGNFGAQRNSMQMVSYQLQDVAVQAQMGTSAFTILGQQGPQLASAFGPGGAVVGAFIAFGAILGGVAFKMLSAGQSAKDLEEKVKGLGLEFSQLNAEQQKLIRTQNELRINELIAENEKLASATQTTTGKLGLAAAMTGKATEDFDDMNGALNRNAVQMDLNTQEIQRLRDQNAGLSESTKDLIDRLEEEHAMLGLTARQRDIESAKRDGAAPQQIEEINRLHDLLDAKEREVELREQNKERIQEEEEARATAIEAAEKAAEKRLQKALTANETQVQSLQRQLNEELALLEQDRLAAVVVAEQKGQDIEAVNETYREAAINAETATAERIAGVKDRARQKELQEEARANQERIRSQQNVTNSLLAAEEMLLKGKSQSTRMAAKLAINLADQEKRENATKIISDSYAAAMGAYKALASIPFIGPALGAAAAGTILAAGTAYATQSLAGRASGGQVRGGETYLVGERGPELLTMGGSGRVSSNDQLKQAVGGGGGITVVNNVDARGADGTVDIKIRKAMQETAATTIETIRDLSRRRRFL